MAEKKLKFHNKGEGRAIIEIARSYPQKSTIRELVTNSIDERIPDRQEDIVVTINPHEKRVIVSDNGQGILYDDLKALSQNLGYSTKAGHTDKRGEKALGLLSFGSLGNVMHIVSRHYESREEDYGYVRWEIKENKGEIIADDKKIDPRTVEETFYGNFPNGTRVIIDRINPHILNKILTHANLKNWLRTIYSPALRKEIVNIQLGKLDKRTKQLRTESLDALIYDRDSSVELLNETIPLTVKDQEEPGELEVLLYLDPEAAYDKVGIYSKDVLVYESIAELPEFVGSSVWTSGKLSGYINDNNNKLVLGREAINKNSNTFKGWVEGINEVEERIRPMVEESKKRGKKIKENSYIKEAYDAFASVMKDLNLKKTGIGEELTRSSDGEIINVIGVEPTTKRGSGKGSKRSKSKVPSGKAPGPGTFRESEDGYPVRVVKKGGVPFACPQPVEFQLNERHLRSKLEDRLGRPTLFLNSAHEDYQSRMDLKDKLIFLRYALTLMAKENAGYRIRIDEREGLLLGKGSELVDIALQEEETGLFNTLRKLGIK